MPLIACGINHKTATLASRELLAFTQEAVPATLRELLAAGAANEAMLLSTCNRTDIYAYTEDLLPLRTWLQQHPRMVRLLDTHQSYWHQDELAVSHLMRVASGLDSMVIGEPQILGQMKQAFQLAQQHGATGQHLNNLLPKVFAVTKQVRSQTQIGVNPVSIAYVAVSLAKRIFSHLSQTQALLIGSGQTIELAALHLAEMGVKQFIFANRTFEKAQQLAEQFAGQAIAMGDIPLHLAHTHIVASATSSPLPLVGKGMVENALKSRKRRPLLLLDLAIPRDIEAQVADLEDVYLYNIDHLQHIINENLQSRNDAAEQAEAIINLQARYYMRQQEMQDTTQLIRAYREKLQHWRDQAVRQALEQLQQGQNAQQVLAEMARVLTNKISHTPSVQLRQAGMAKQTDILLAARRLLDI